MADKRGVFSMLGDLTAAQATLYSKAAGRRGGVASARRRKRKKTRSTSRARTGKRRASSSRTKTRNGKRAHMVKGSAAAKAWGRKMKRLRKK